MEIILNIIPFTHLININYKHIFFIMTLFLNNIQLFTSTIITSCKEHDYFDNKECFNDIIEFNDKKYRAGKILTNKNNVTTIIFSDDRPGNRRLLYSLDENGRGFFYGNETIVKVLTLTSEYYYRFNIIGRYECVNDFVYLEEDTKREKQYIISISSYLSLTELYDVEGGEHQHWVTTDFLGINDRSRYIFSYRFSLFEWKNTSIYFCVFVQDKGRAHYADYSDSYTITRFRLNKNITNNQISISKVDIIKEEEINSNNRIVSACFIEQYDVFVVFFVKNDYKFTLNFYDYNVNIINVYEYEAMSNPIPGRGAFLKVVHCQFDFIALIYYTNGDDGKSLLLKFIKINERDNYEKFTNLEERLKVEIKDYNFNTDIMLNEFYKINPNRFIFASTIDYSQLYIYLIQQTNMYAYVKIKKYDYLLLSGKRFVREFSFGLYKGF